MKILLGLVVAGMCWGQAPTIGAVTSGAFLNNPAPDSLVTMFGTGLSDGVYYASSIPVPTILGSTTVALCDPNNVCSDCPLLFASPTQVNFYAPPDPSIGGVAVRNGYSYARTVTVSVGGHSASYSADFSPVAPSIFALAWDCDTYSPDGDNSPCGISATSQGPKQVQRGAITDLAGRLVSSDSPAHFGQYYVIYLTGISGDPDVEAFSPAYIDYAWIPVNDPNLNPIYEVDYPAYAGESSYIGLQQINFQINSGFFGGATFPDSVNPYPPKWPCGTRLETEITVAQGYGNSGVDRHEIFLPVVIQKGEIPCL